jgi:4-amino-4-deoxy-L-arabinose transferase-like glycosyltransferase
LEQLPSWVSLAILFCLVALLGDGFLGGGNDDGTYLAIAQQWLAHGPALPANHWEGRWPVILPLAGSLELFGLHRWSVALPSFVFGGVALLLIKRLGDRHFGSPVGIAAAAIFAILPAFSRQATSAAIEPVEVMLVLAAFELVERPFWAGLVMGLAFQARETAIAALPLLLFLSGDRRFVLRILAGFAAPLAVELAAFGLLTGDPLYRRHLSLHHTAIFTNVLPLKTAHPLFNRDVIAGWHRELGLHVHWAVDGYLNLVLSPLVAVLPVLTLVQFARGPRDPRVAFLLLAALFYSAVLIYALAIFPTPRMFLPALAALAIAFAATSVHRRDAVTIAFAATIAAMALLNAAAHPSSRHWQSIAESWVAEHPGMIETRQQGYFTFSPSLQRLPGSGRPYLMVLKDRPCSAASDYDPGDLSALPVAAEATGGPGPDLLRYPWRMCLYRLSNYARITDYGDSAPISG